jgi:Ni,Fe-hydrogenase III small subunit/ferredoxin
MNSPLLSIIRTGIITQRSLFPDLTDDAIGLPSLSQTPCRSADCMMCVRVCPMHAITVDEGAVSLDLGRCLGCNACVAACPSGTIVPDRSTRTAVRTRGELVISNRTDPVPALAPTRLPFQRSLHVREVSTGDNACDLEVLASTNAMFDVARMGIHFVASPRFADALLVTGPVGRAMQEPLRRCYDAMAEPRLVIAAGVSAISGGIHADGYAEANGVSSILPVSAYIPGDPPHPWSIIHGLMLAMGRLK